MKTRTFIGLSVLAVMLIGFGQGCNGQNRGNQSSTSMNNNNSNSLPSQTYETTTQTMNATTTVKTLSWNLGTQIVGTTPVPGGGTFQIGVQEVIDQGGNHYYYLSNPTIVGGSSAILVQNIGFQLNGVFISTADVFNGVNRMIPAGASRVLMMTTQVLDVASPPGFNPADTLTVTFGALAPTTFNPPTYTALANAGGIWAVNCEGCHSGATPAAGMDLSKAVEPANYNFLIDNFIAVPFQPLNSLMIQHLNATNGQTKMPPTPNQPLTQAQINSISDWISDGAPNN